MNKAKSAGTGGGESREDEVGRKEEKQVADRKSDQAGTSVLLDKT